MPRKDNSNLEQKPGEVNVTNQPPAPDPPPTMRDQAGQGDSHDLHISGRDEMTDEERRRFEQAARHGRKGGAEMPEDDPANNPPPGVIWPSD